MHLPGGTPNLYLLTATQVLSLFEQRAITVEQYARSLLIRIEERDDKVKAWAFLDPEYVLSQARALDRVPHAERGPLHGIAVGVKDVFDTKDMPTEYGSPLYKGSRPATDASTVSILRSAGALIFGKTTTSEFTVTNSGPLTTNPHDSERTPGGSSAGSAAAVADFQVPLSIGTQTGGSIIRPASYCGLYGYKPTYNAVSSEGAKLVSINIDTVGFFSRSIEDLQLLNKVFAIKDDEAPQKVPLENLRMAAMKTPLWSKAGPSTRAAMERAVNTLKNHGFEVEDVSFPEEIDDIEVVEKINSVVFSTDAQSAFLKEYRFDKSHLDQEIRDLVENRSGYTRKDRAYALDRYASLRPLFDKITADYATIITPSAEDEAPLGIGDFGSPTFNFFWTGVHLPAINIPVYRGQNNMPIGLSLVAGRGLISIFCLWESFLASCLLQMEVGPLRIQALRYESPTILEP